MTSFPSVKTREHFEAIIKGYEQQIASLKYANQELTRELTELRAYIDRIRKAASERE